MSDTDRPRLADLAGVRYVGTSDQRVLSVADFAAAGVTVEHDLVWTAGETLPIAGLHAAVVDLLAADADFVLVAKDA